MLKRFLPKEAGFFQLFRESTEEMTFSIKEFELLLADLENSEGYVRKIAEHEQRADEIIHKTMKLLHSTFITPIDRDDIHTLISKLDDIVDLINACAQRILLFEIKTAPDELKQMTEVCVESIALVKIAVALLENLKDPSQLLKTCVELNSLENEADRILRMALAKLFKSEPDVKTLIKFKEIYELMESITDRCEDVANIIEGIVLEYA